MNHKILSFARIASLLIWANAHIHQNTKLKPTQTIPTYKVNIARQIQHKSYIVGDFKLPAN